MKKCECSQTETIQRIQDELARKERQDNCEHRGLVINIDSDGYVGDAATCVHCGKKIEGEGGFRRKFSVKRIFKMFVPLI